MRKTLALLFLFLVPTLSHAATYFVRDGGGSATQCTGLSNVVYPGSGSGVACAFSHPRLAIGWDVDNPQAGTITGGDTVSIDGDSDVNAGQQAQYLIGYDGTGAGTTPSCNTGFPYDCILANLPAGSDATHRTTIIGTGTHRPQLWGNERAWQIIDAENDFIALENLEVTDHSSCNKDYPINACNYSGSYPHGPWAVDGIKYSGNGSLYQDLYVHGVGRYGMQAETLTTNVFTRVWLIGNGLGGWNSDITAALNGTTTLNQPIIEWNGCEEAYPLTNAGIVNPANYSICSGQNGQSIIADGLSVGSSGNINSGNWILIGPGSISFNTQDGFDLLHGNGNGNISIDKMKFEGNAGQQIKANAFNFSLTNSAVIGDCGWWYQATQSYSGFNTSGSICRAGGDVILFNVTLSSTANMFNNTIVSNGGVVIESTDGQNTGCNSSTSINFKNNIVLGGYVWPDDTTWNGSGGNSLTTYYYADGYNDWKFVVSGITTWPLPGVNYTTGGNTYTVLQAPTSGSSGTIYFSNGGDPGTGGSTTLTKSGTGTGDTTMSSSSNQLNSGNGDGTCGVTGNGSLGLLNPTEDYNIVTGTKNTNFGCNGAHDQCGVSPGFTGSIPMGASGGAANTFYQGQAATTLIPLGASSPAITAGVNGLSYWDTPNDYYLNAADSPRTLGNQLRSSTGASGFLCFFNSDCTSNSCVSNICSSGGGGGGVAGAGSFDFKNSSLDIKGIDFN